MHKARLGELLSRHVASNAREAGYRQRMLDLLGLERPFERSHFDPGHFTASAIVLSPEQDSILLIFHKKLKLWLQPGGHVDPEDRSILETARREVLEEVGITDLDVGGGQILDLDIHSIPAYGEEPPHEHFDVRFSFVARSREIERTDEVAEARWVLLDDVSQLSKDESVLRALDKVRGGARRAPA